MRRILHPPVARVVGHMAKDELTEDACRRYPRATATPAPTPSQWGQFRPSPSPGPRPNGSMMSSASARPLRPKCGPETLESEFVGVERPVGVRRVPGSRRAGPLGEKRHAAREDQHAAASAVQLVAHVTADHDVASPCGLLPPDDDQVHRRRRPTREPLPQFRGQRAAVRGRSLVGPARGTAIDLIAPPNCVRRPAAAMATATEPPSRRYSADVQGST